MACNFVDIDLHYRMLGIFRNIFVFRPRENLQSISFDWFPYDGVE